MGRHSAQPVVTILVPAYQEQDCIRDTIESLLAQTVPVDIVVLPNGCTDDTEKIAREYPIQVLSFDSLPGRKTEAMNRGWLKYCHDSDFVISVDADTVLVPTAVADWLAEFAENPKLAGSCARFTMVQDRKFITRLQRMDFAMGIDLSLRRGWTSVLAGAGSCFRNSVLKEIAGRLDREGPWTYQSAVEDFEVTYRARQLGYAALVSPTVRAYTGAMPTWKALKAQRLKWVAGTIQDLMKFGLNKYTWVMWAQQLLGMVSFLILVIFLTLMGITIASGVWHYSSIGLVVSVVIPLLILTKNIKHACRIPHADKWDIAMAGSVLVYEVFSWIRTYWFLSSWFSVLQSKITRNHRDLWARQYKAEGKIQEEVNR